MKFFVFLIFALIPLEAFAYRQSSTCIRIEDVNDLAPSAAPRCSGAEQAFGFTWNKLQVPYVLGEAGSADFDNTGAYNEVLRSELVDSFDQWSTPDCSSFEFVFDGFSSLEEHAVDDINWVGFIETGWPHASGAIALTTVTTQTDGVIVDADMELNGEQNVFAVVDGSETDAVHDIRNVVVHESGHMLGLDHSAVADATMQFNAPPRQTQKGTLHADDIEGLCAVYPLDFDPPDTDPPKTDDGCCRQIRTRTPFGVVVPVVLFLIIGVRRKRISLGLFAKTLMRQYFEGR